MRTKLVKDNDYVITKTIQRLSVDDEVCVEYAKAVLANHIVTAFMSNGVNDALNKTDFILNNMNIGVFIHRFNKENVQNIFIVCLAKYLSIHLNASQVEKLCNTIMDDIIMLRD